MAIVAKYTLILWDSPFSWKNWDIQTVRMRVSGSNWTSTGTLKKQMILHSWKFWQWRKKIWILIFWENSLQLLHISAILRSDEFNDWTELGVGPSTDGWSKFLSMFKTFTLDTALSKASGHHYIYHNLRKEPGRPQGGNHQGSMVNGPRWL